MNCRKFEQNLDEFIAGKLNNRLSKAMVRHMRECLACSILVKQENELVFALKGLKTAVPPGPGLWEQVETKISSRAHIPVAGRLWHFFTGSKAVMAVSLCIFFAGILFGAVFLNPAAWNRLINRDKTAGTYLAGEFDIAETTYSQAKNALLSTIRNNKQLLDEAAVNIIEENLGLIDKAIGDMKTAIYNHPENRQNIMRLADLYQDETRYLLKTNSILTGIN